MELVEVCEDGAHSGEGLRSLSDWSDSWRGRKCQRSVVNFRAT
jgi:hypothetical protein